MSLSRLLDQLSGQHVLIVGDVMIDEYIFGSIDRISPEAPVMVVRKRDHRMVPGGAANVAKNIVALGASATVIGVVGQDSKGSSFVSALAETPGLRSEILEIPGRPTTCKTRVVANHSHQVLRIDEEDDEDLIEEFSAQLRNRYQKSIEKADVVLLSDYRKGVLTKSLCKELIEIAVSRGVPVVANAKPSSAHFFAGSHLVTLNRKEAEDCIGHSIPNREIALSAAKSLQAKLNVKGVVITLGDLGLVSTFEEQELVVPAPSVEAYDVAGAGDTAISSIALGMGVLGFEMDVFRLAVEASARVIQHVGVAVLSSDDLESIRSLV